MSDDNRAPVIVRIEFGSIHDYYFYNRNLRWIGELVDVDDAIVELHTDKATVELVSPVRGVLTEITAVGELKLGDPVFTIQPLEAGERLDPGPAARVVLTGIWDTRRLTAKSAARRAWADSVFAYEAGRGVALSYASRYALSPEVLEASILVDALLRAIAPLPTLYLPAIQSPGSVHLNYGAAGPDGVRWTAFTVGPPHDFSATHRDARPVRDPEARLMIVQLQAGAPLVAIPEPGRGLVVIFGEGAPAADEAGPSWAPLTILADGGEAQEPLRHLLAGLIEQLGLL